MKFLSPRYLLLVIFSSTWSYAQDGMFFEVVPAEKSGIHFKNSLIEVDTFNYLNFQYMYNGGGVAIGDINNDGLSDIYFTGNQVSDKLYLNKGGLRFEDITKKAIGDLAAEGWHTGVTMADVNADGFLDIYVCRSGLESFGNERSNLLYINNQNKTFTESGSGYGVNVSKGSNQAAFFDMDNDGDLDLYVMNRPYDPTPRGDIDPMGFPNSDDLLENRSGKFINISEAAGIKNKAFGLGIGISDIDRDGYLDIYVSNDYVQPDFCYINNGDNSFRDEIKIRTRHVSHFGMGNDLADFNNDGFVDIMTVDMATTDHIKSKKTMAGMNPQEFWNSIERGNQHEYMFNTLQLNNGNGTFSEIAQLARVSKTDWSWGPLLADFDNDGLKDMFVSTGYRREVRDNDYVIKLRGLNYRVSDFKEILEMAEETKAENKFFRNVGGLRFEKSTADWKMNYPINSNGAAYADLDSDGDLDLVINNMEDISSILENKLKSKNHYLRVTADEHFDGAEVTVKVGDQTYFQEFYRSRGYQSSTEGVLHFGLGEIDEVSMITIKFRNGRSFSLYDVETNQTLQIEYSKAKEINSLDFKNRSLFRESDGLKFRHVEYRMNDFMREILLPHRMSELGPFVSAGDVNGDKLTDFYLSGSRYYAGTMFIQNVNGRFRKIEGPWIREHEREEQGSEFFDCDGDGDLDLYIASGGNEYVFYSGQQKEENYNLNLQDQLYINNGKGKFTNETRNRLPEMVNSSQRMSIGDYDNDGDPDIFVGGRQIPGYYPFAPRSYLLQNDGQGIFSDVTVSSKDLSAPGLVTESLFDDFDRDGDLDLIVVGEWMAPSFYQNNEGIFTNMTSQFGLENEIGWWTSIAKGDFNGDGKNDYVIGNLGNNNKFHPSEDKPLEIYVKDFDGNGTHDIVLGKYQEGSCYPVRGRQCSSEQMPFIMDKFPTYDEFANADLSKIYGSGQLDSALHYSAIEFSSALLLSTPNGFSKWHLPVEAQMGPLNALEVVDFNNDGNLDILGVGNNYGAEIETVRYDGGRGILLLGNGDGTFRSQAPNQSGFLVRTDAKDMVLVDGYVVVASNNDSLKLFEWKR